MICACGAELPDEMCKECRREKHGSPEMGHAASYGKPHCLWERLPHQHHRRVRFHGFVDPSEGQDMTRAMIAVARPGVGASGSYGAANNLTTCHIDDIVGIFISFNREEAGPLCGERRWGG